MDNHITLSEAKSRLDLQGISYAQLPLGDGFSALITQYGGRLIGPFSGEQGQSVLWITKEMTDDDAFSTFIKNRSWNLGGERLWINPELKFFCQSPETFDDTYTVQSELDPGNYALMQSNDGVHLEQSCTVKVLGSGEEKSFFIHRRYAPAPNPLAYNAELKDADVGYCGYLQDVYLKDTSPAFPLELEPWILTQINPGGQLVVPYFGDFDSVDYYEPVGARQQVFDGYAQLDVTGCDKFKVAYRAAQTFGRMGYVRHTDEGWQLMIRNYYNDPSAPYLSEPWGELDNRGCSFYCYNDHGLEDGFAEFENSCPPIGEKAGRSECHSTTSVWFFFGSQYDIGRIMKNLLGIDYKF